MYSESDVQSAVEAGAISSAAAAALRDHVASVRQAPAVDEEQFRLVTGFNDIFVTIACLLVVFAAAAVGGTLGPAYVGALLVAAVSWGMAEVFTRRRRMALPSIVLLLSFVIALGMAGSGLLEATMTKQVVNHGLTRDDKRFVLDGVQFQPWQTALMSLGGAIAATIGAVLHWRRFRVPITIAAAVGALVLLLLSLVAALRNETVGQDPWIAPAALACGVAVFAFAIRWDMSDRARVTPRANVVFWLHLVAAPLIAHPLFYWMGVTGGGEVGVGKALGVLAIYLGFACVALAVDRRALLVSALTYVLIGLARLFRSYGAIELNVALTALVIGSALLALSTWWHVIRARLIVAFSAGVQRRLPASG